MIGILAGLVAFGAAWAARRWSILEDDGRLFTRVSNVNSRIAVVVFAVLGVLFVVEGVLEVVR